MKLLWCQYQSKSNQINNILLVELGVKDNKLYCIDDRLLETSEKSILRRYSNALDKLNLDDKILWIKDNYESIIKKVKSYRLDKLVILRTYDIKSN